MTPQQIASAEALEASEIIIMENNGQFVMVIPVDEETANAINLAQMGFTIVRKEAS